MSEATIYTEELAERICIQVAEARSLRAICAEEGMPDKATIFRWLAQKPEFRERYALAKEMMMESFFWEIIDIADDSSQDTISTDKGDFPNREWIERSKVRVDTRKWLMSKLAPKKYGDRQQIEHSGELGRPVPMTLAEFDQRYREATAS